jgi:Regulator of chromosome condensation (RCC1) repeat
VRPLRLTSFRIRLVANMMVAAAVACSAAPVGQDGSAASGGQDDGGSSGEAGTQAGLAGGGTLAGTPGVGGSSGAAGANAGGVAGEAGRPNRLKDYAIVSTSRGNCALDSAGAIHCWGYLPNIWSVPGGVFVELHASIDSVCAIRSDRTLTCFDTPGAAPSGIADFAPKGKVLALAQQRGALCGVDESGQTFCNSDYPELTVPSGEAFSQLSVGIQFACGIRSENGSINCWGFPGDSACVSHVPAAGQLVAPAGDFVSISSGFYSSCALDKAGLVSCWGAGTATDDPAELCMGSTFNLGQAAPPNGTFRSVNVAVNHACGVKTDGTIACWGAGTTDEDCPDTSVNCRQSRPPIGVFEQVSVGNVHSCAITAERKVQCWGYPGAGAGDGRLVPPTEFQ